MEEDVAGDVSTGRRTSTNDVSEGDGKQFCPEPILGPSDFG